VLVSISDRNGNMQELGYSEGKLVYVEDNFGRRTDFVYNDEGRISSLETPIGTFAYEHDGVGNLTGVEDPSGGVRSYLYQDPNDSHNLTGVVDERGVEAGRYEYDVLDRAIVSEGGG